MEIITRDRPAFASVRQDGCRRSNIAESDAMASMSTTLTIKTRWNGGFFGVVLRRIFGGETLFINDFIANAPGELVLTQPFRVTLSVWN